MPSGGRRRAHEAAHDGRCPLEGFSSVPAPRIALPPCREEQSTPPDQALFFSRPTIIKYCGPAAFGDWIASKKAMYLYPFLETRSIYLIMHDMSRPPGQVPELVARAAAGDRAAIVELLERYRGRLRRMVAMRLDPRLRGRVDASDVIQEGYLDALRRLDEFVRDPSVPFYIWLRFLVGQRVHEQHRRHLGTPGRDVGREVSLYRGAMPGASIGALAARLLGNLTSPSQAAMRAERKIRLQEALNRMDPLDREILVLRHYEQMTNGDAAAALGLDKSAASKRYTRALERLKDILTDLPGEISKDRE